MTENSVFRAVPTDSEVSLYPSTWSSLSTIPIASQSDLSTEIVGSKRARMPATKARAWCVTLQLPVPSDETPEHVASSFFVPSPPPVLGVTFGRGQVDFSPASERLSFNGYFETSQQVTSARVQSWMPEADFVPVSIDQRASLLSACLQTSRRMVLPPLDEEVAGGGGGDASSVAGSRDESPFAAFVVSSVTTHDTHVMWTLGSPERPKPGNRGGSWMDPSKPGGGSAQMEAVVAVLRAEGPRRGPEMVAKMYPKLFMQYHNGVARLAEMLAPKPRDEDFVPRPWQAALLKVLAGDPHPRHIIWIADPRGDSGKSMLSTHICCEHDGILMQGKAADMAYAFNGQRVVIFDFARPVSLSECRDCFELAEGFKNRFIFSGKYVSGMKQVGMAHVVFMSNAKPPGGPDGPWTGGRLQLFELSPTKSFSAATAPSPWADGFVDAEADDATVVDRMVKDATERLDQLAVVTHDLMAKRLAKSHAGSKRSGSEPREDASETH